MRGSAPAASALVAAVVLAGCAHAPPPGPAGGTALPPIPEVRGDLSLYVAYPDSLDPVFASDSNFVFGTTGTGAAELTVNGHPVTVHPNGSFLAWLPLPDPVAGDTASYRLVARAGGRVDTLIHRFRVPLLARPDPREMWVDSATADAPVRWALPGEEVDLSLKAAPGLDVTLTVRRSAWWAASRDTLGARGRAGGGHRPAPTGEEGAVPEARARRGVPVERALDVVEEAPGRYVARAGAMELLTGVGTADGSGGSELELGTRERATGVLAADTLELGWRAVRGRDTVRLEGEFPLRVLDPGRLPVAELREAPDPVHGRAGSVPVRPSPRGSYAWLLPPGSRAPVDGRRGDRIRLRLGEGSRAWAAAEDVSTGAAERLPTDGGVLTAGVGTVSAEALDDRIRVRMPVERRLPAHVSMPGPRTLAVTVHGGLGETERIVYPTGGGPIRGLRWEQLPGPRWRLRVRLSAPVWGWDLRWEEVPRPVGTVAGGSGEAGTELASPEGRSGDGRSGRGGAVPGRLVLEVRRPPQLDPGNPLAGLPVAVDPGHPPVGAEGPTGLAEAEANLAVARRLVRRLRAAGAEPMLVREDTAPVGLYERRRRAREGGARVLISIHNNALPDGVRPFGQAGTSTYYFHPHARRLARRIQEGMLEGMGLRDRGVRWGNLALPRESWMPSVLTEGAFMMIPRHEAALRTEAFQDAYAGGVLQGLRAWLEARARSER